MEAMIFLLVGINLLGVPVKPAEQDGLPPTTKCGMRVVRLAGLLLWLLAVLKVLLVDTSSLATPARVAVFASVGLLLLACAFLYLKFKSRFEEDA